MEIFRKLQKSYGDSVLSWARVFEWFKACSENRLKTNLAVGRPSTATNDENIVGILHLVKSVARDQKGQRKGQVSRFFGAD